MAGRHVILVVEDTPAIAKQLEKLLGALGYETVMVTSRSEVEEAIKAPLAVCLVLLDVQIKPEPDSDFADVEFGRATLRSARRAYSARAPQGGHLLPIITMSALETERTFDSARQALFEGADYCLKKPFSLENRPLTEVIEEVLEKSGRADHADCARLSGQAQAGLPGAEATDPVLHLDGPVTLHADDRLTKFTIRTVLKDVEVSPKPLAMLLQLIDARNRFDGGCLPYEELGDERYLEALRKNVSDLRKELRPALPKELKRLVHPQRGQGYLLDARLKIGRINKVELAKHTDEVVREVARRLPD